MGTFSIGSLAQQSYTQIQDRPIDLDTGDTETQIKNAELFQEKFKKAQSNNFTSKTSNQILNTIQITNSKKCLEVSNYHNSGIVNEVTKLMRNTLSKQERVATKSVIGKSSPIELLTTITQTKTLAGFLTKAWNKFLEAWHKIMNTPM